MSLEIRPERDTDFATIDTLVRLAFHMTDGSEVQMIHDIRASDRYIPDLALVATLEGSVVAHGLFAYETLRGDMPARVLNLGPMSVLPEFQRQGIGSALILEGIRRAREMQQPLITCVGHPWFYPRFGWRPAREFGIEPDWDAMMVLPLAHNLERFQGLQFPT